MSNFNVNTSFTAQTNNLNTGFSVSNSFYGTNTSFFSSVNSLGVVAKTALVSNLLLSYNPSRSTSRPRAGIVYPRGIIQ